MLGLPDACFQTSPISFQSRHSGGEPVAQCTVHPEPVHSESLASVVVPVLVVAAAVSAIVVVMVDVLDTMSILLHAGVQVESPLQCASEEPHHPHSDRHWEVSGQGKPVHLPTAGWVVTLVVLVVVVVDKKPDVLLVVVEEDVEGAVDVELSSHAAVQIEFELQ